MQSASEQWSLPRINPLLIATVGIGFFMAWEMIGYSPTLLTGVTYEAALHMDDVLWYEETGRILALAVVAVLVFLRPGRPSHRGVFAVAAALVAMGTIGLYAITGVGVASPWAVALCEVPMCCKVILAVLWCEVLCRFGTKQVLQVLAAANVLAVVITFSNSLLPTAVQMVLHSAMPLLACATYLKLGVTDSRCLPACPTSVRDVRIPWGVLAGVGVFNMVLVVIKKMSEIKTAMPDEASWLIADLLVCAALLLYTADRQRPINVALLVKWTFPLYALSMVAVFAGSDMQTLPEVYAIGCSWAYLYILYWLIWRCAATKTNVPAVCLFAIGQILLTFGAFVGNEVFVLIERLNMPFYETAALVCVLIILNAVFMLDSKRVSEAVDEEVLLFDVTNDAMCNHCVDQATRIYGLTARERAIAGLIIRDADNQEIAAKLVITMGTLRRHLHNLYAKTETSGREELTVLLRSLAGEQTN